MQKLFMAICLVLGFIALGFGAGKTSTARHIKVCILNDTKASVHPDVIESIAWRSFLNYSLHTNIVFEPNEPIPYNGDVTAWSIDQGLYMATACPCSCELRILFSNQKIFTSNLGTEGNSAASNCNLAPEDLKQKDDIVMSGTSNVHFGFIVLYNVGGRLDDKDAGGNPALSTVLNHELGHMFGLEHSQDTNSFMYCPSNKSKGQWDGTTLNQMNAARRKSWFKLYKCR